MVNDINAVLSCLHDFSAHGPRVIYNKYHRQTRGKAVITGILVAHSHDFLKLFNSQSREEACACNGITRHPSKYFFSVKIKIKTCIASAYRSRQKSRRLPVWLPPQPTDVGQNEETTLDSMFPCLSPLWRECLCCYHMDRHDYTFPCFAEIALRIKNELLVPVYNFNLL